MSAGSELAALLDVEARVADALARGDPVVVLESTLIAHGLPWPRNFETAQAMIAEVQAAGAVPAVVAIERGRIRIGLDEAALERFATARGISKAGPRDLAPLVASRRDGATTVAGTLACAALAGVAVLATGGIGGVHRGAEASFDVSADLGELARAPLAVVASGAKSLLDLAKTLEVLETHGVPVVGYGTGELPAFYARTSGLALEARVDTPEQAARLIQAHRALGRGGLLIAHPVPEQAAIGPETLERFTARALAEAEARGIRGKAITPFVLERLFALTEGRTLAANEALLRANAALAGRIAAALARL